MEIPGKPEVIDILFLIFCLRVSYISIKNGLLKETFKIAGAGTGSFFAFQYYSGLSTKISRKVFFLNQEYSEFLSFIFILGLVYAAFSIVRLVLGFFLKKEELSGGEKAASFAAGILRSVFLLSLFFYSLNLLALPPRYYEKSISFSLFKNIAPAFYSGSFKAYEKFFPEASADKKAIEYYRDKKISK